MIYVDLGAYTGDTVDQYVSWGQLWGDISNSIVYAFEPVDFSDEWDNVKGRQSQHVKEMHFIQKAAWVHGKGMDFSTNDIGSTLMSDKNTWLPETVTRVPTFDFSEWLDDFHDDETYIKFDIEGSEYPILERMIQDGTDKLPKLMMIEWHASKMGKHWMEKEKWIKDNLHCDWIEWR